MTKKLGFLTDARKDPGYRPKKKRLSDFQPVELTLSNIEIKEQVGRCMECGTPFCHGCGCPLGNVIPECNELVYQNRWVDALDLLLSTNPFPEFTGRICPAPCEASCVAALNGDAIAIRQMERAVIENGFKNGLMVPRLPQTRRSGRVAVIGSGPAGLAVAERLNQSGYNVTVFEEAAKLGGILRYGIPNFKLGKDIIHRRIHLMMDEGIRFEMKVCVGDDLSYHYLQERFHAIVLTGGACEPRDLKVPGRELSGIHFAMDYLICQNKKDIGEYVHPKDNISAKGKNVVIIGGGDTGSDCLGTALRQQAKRVYQLEIMPKLPQTRQPDNPWPQWPQIHRESSSHNEGGERRWSVKTTEWIGTDGTVSKLKGIEVDWVEQNERPIPVVKKGTKIEIEVDLVLLAMGFIGPGKNKLVDDLGLEKDTHGNIKTSATHQTRIKTIFAAGDMVHGQSLVVHAIADGIAVAKSVEKYLECKGL